jgi:3-phenylpropionate/trans-cinnamate dioxygenase ferredoxin reductase component
MNCRSPSPPGRVVVVGGSLAGARVAATLREAGFPGDVTVLDAEPHPPYDRYPLSKDFLTAGRSPSSLALPQPDGVTWRTGCRVARADLRNRLVELVDGEVLRYDAMLVSTGARPRVGPEAGIPGVSVVRTVDDAAVLRGALARKPRSLVVVGGGLIGSEVASSATELGVHVTLIDRNQMPLRRTLGAAVATHLMRCHLSRGVRVRTGSRPAGLETNGGRVAGVRLDGGEVVAADLVVLATGTRPNVEWLHGNGLDLTDGLVCRPTLHVAGFPRVLAAGDVARVVHPLAGAPARVESWFSALAQAELAARNLLCAEREAEPFSAVPEFGTTIHGVRIRSVGFPPIADSGRVTRGTPGDGRWIHAFSRAGRLVGAVSVNAHEELHELRAELAARSRSLAAGSVSS